MNVICSYGLVSVSHDEFKSEVDTEHLQCIFMTYNTYHGVSFQQNANETLKHRKQYY